MSTLIVKIVAIPGPHCKKPLFHVNLYRPLTFRILAGRLPSFALYVQIAEKLRQPNVALDLGVSVGALDLN